MKGFLTAIFFFCLLIPRAFAQHYNPVEQNSIVQFHVSHQMIFKSTVTGSFKGLKGTIIFDPKNLPGSLFDVSVLTNTISTGTGMRDNDLKKEKYFNALKFPLITIKSQTITTSDNDNKYTLSASLTIKGTTQTITFPFTAIPQNGGYIFKGHFKINRLEFNIGPDNSIDKEVEIDLNVTAK
jgi:polyisoprenoid-binding protein YceI